LFRTIYAINSDNFPKQLNPLRKKRRDRRVRYGRIL